MGPMKILLWTLFGVVALLWTGAAALATAVIRAVQGVLAGQSSVDLAAWISGWSVPNWLLALIDVRWVQAVQVFLVQLLEELPHDWPMLAQPVGWLVPVVWFVWALVLLLMLAVILGLHWLVTDTKPGPKPPAASPAMPVASPTAPATPATPAATPPGT